LSFCPDKTSSKLSGIRMAQTKKQVLVYPIDFTNSPQALAFKSKYDVTVVPYDNNKPKLLQLARDCHAIIARNFRVDRDLISVAKNLQIIALTTVGYEYIDVAYAIQRGIWVTNSRATGSDSVANLALAHLLNVSRRFSEAERWLREGNFAGGWERFLGRDPEGKTLGIIGMGSIGKQLAKRANALEMKIIYYNRNRLPESEERLYGNAKFVTKDELLAQSDYISVHVFASEATKHILDTPDFAKMKNGVYIINTSRGVTINEQALVDALKSGKVAGAGLDVFETEPKVHPELKKFPNVSLTPHIGVATIDARFQKENLTMANVESVLDGKGPITPVPECKGMKISKL